MKIPGPDMPVDYIDMRDAGSFGVFLNETGVVNGTVFAILKKTLLRGGGRCA